MKQPTLAQEHPASYVLREWAHWRGKDNQKLLRSWTSHPQLGRAALEALTELNVGSGDEILIELWRKHAAEKKDAFVYHQVAAIGGDQAKRAALELFRKSGASPLHEIGCGGV